VNPGRRWFRVEPATLRKNLSNHSHRMKLLKHSLTALLVAPGLAMAHPGHAVLDPSAGAPHAGHEGELLLFVLPALAVCALAVRAYRQTRG